MSNSVTPGTEAHQAFLSMTNSQSLLKLMSIESVIPPKHFILCHLLLLLPSIFPSIRVFFQMSQISTSGGQSIGAPDSASVLAMTIQNWFPLGLTGLISLQFKRLSRFFSTTTIQKQQFFHAQPAYGPTLNPYMTNGKTTGLTRWKFLAQYCLCFWICCLCCS